MLLLFALVASVSFVTVASDRVPRSCPPCNATACDPLPADGCEFGTFVDSCGCCSLCAAGLGEPCGGRGSSAKRCAAGMECVKKDTEKKGKYGVCSCKSDYEVCGTDGVTYKTGCALKAASLKAVKDKQPEIKVQNKGKCARAPAIVTAPGEVWNVTGSQVYLSCEATGIPTPVLTWKKIISNKGKTDLLPGDKDNLAIQTRGGPEKHEVTGWVLVSTTLKYFALTEAEDGLYECHASNSKGEASAVGTIHVVKSLSDIPSKKDVPAGKEEEL